MVRKSKTQLFHEQLAREELHRWDEMWDSMTAAYEALEDKSGIEERYTRLDGFDANKDEECVFLNLVRYRDVGGYNSNGSRLHRYRGMYSRWERSSDQKNLTRDDLIRITTPPWRD